MLQKKRNNMRGGKGRRQHFDYAEVIRVALKHESMGQPKFAMLIASWTGASDRAALNWLNGVSGPSGAYLIYLMRRSDEVLKTVLGLAQRQELLTVYFEREASKEKQKTRVSSISIVEDYILDQSGVPVRDPDDPDNVPDPYTGLGIRQKWFIAQLEMHTNVRAQHIANFFDVSVKTGKRDIAFLKEIGMVSFAGNARRGRYVLVR